MTPADLIPRLRTVTSPSRELNAQILALRIGGTAAISPFNGEWCVYRGTVSGRPSAWRPETAAERAWWTRYDFSGSIDDALSLFPPGLTLDVTLRAMGRDGAGYAELTDGKNFLGSPTTEALRIAPSLCIAALLMHEAGGFVEACRIADAGPVP